MPEVPGTVMCVICEDSYYAEWPDHDAVPIVLEDHKTRPIVGWICFYCEKVAPALAQKVRECVNNPTVA